MAKTERLETEPIFGIRIEFCDGSNPMEWFNLNLVQATKVLQEWSENWILIPEECKLNCSMWKWHANVRKVPEEENDRKTIETYADILDNSYYPPIDIEEEEEETEPCE